MYNECSTVLHAVAPLLDRANRGIASIGVQPAEIISIEGQTEFLGRLLSRLGTGPVWAKDQGKVRSALQSGYMLKKYRFGGNPDERYEKAIRGFIARNSSLSLPCQDPWLKGVIQKRMSRILQKVLPVVSDWTPGFGNGAVAEHIPWLARWERISTYPELHHGFLLPVTLGLSLHGGEAVRLCAVPKDYAKDRLITVEPWLNTFVQHATRRLAYESIHAGPLRGTCMDALHVDSERIQRALAVEGSRRNGPYATLDLSDASDSISLRDVETVFPSWLIGFLTACRTPHFDAGDGELRETLMYAGMGNATTFVVQTLYFWAACVAIAELSGNRRSFVSVHGDDIIVDNRTCSCIQATGAFQALGLKLNVAKSFWGDCSFRESCGIWALNGQDVTPSRFDGFDLGTFPGRIGFSDVIRRMLNSGCGMQLMLADRLVKAASHCMKIVPVDVPGSELVPDKRELWSDRYDRLETRLNKDIQVLEVKAEMPAPRTIKVPADRVGYLYGALLGKCVTTDARRSEPTKRELSELEYDMTFSAVPSPEKESEMALRFHEVRADWLKRGRIRDHVVAIPAPAGETRTKKRWVPIEGFPMGVSSRFR